MKDRQNWSEEELILAFNLYCKLPFGQYHGKNRRVIELAKIIGRTPSAVGLKLCNFARLDPIHQKRGISGMSHGSKLEQIIWDKFNNNWEDLAYESELLLAKSTGQKEFELIKDINALPPGKEKEASVKVRINQNFFRSMILANYRSRCAICSMPEPRLLIAAHIIPWSVDASLRMSPQNGICMCALHDRAFDAGLMTIDSDYIIVLSKDIKKLSVKPAIEGCFMIYEGNNLTLPDKFKPERKFIKYHKENIFVG